MEQNIDDVQFIPADRHLWVFKPWRDSKIDLPYWVNREQCDGVACAGESSLHVRPGLEIFFLSKKYVLKTFSKWYSKYKISQNLGILVVFNIFFYSFNLIVHFFNDDNKKFLPLIWIFIDVNNVFTNLWSIICKFNERFNNEFKKILMWYGNRLYKSHDNLYN